MSVAYLQSLYPYRIGVKYLLPATCLDRGVASDSRWPVCVDQADRSSPRPLLGNQTRPRRDDDRQAD